MPPSTSVWPSFTSVSVFAWFLAMAGEPVGVSTLSSGALRVTSIFMMMLRSAVMCGVTFSDSTASMNSSWASPFSKVWNGIDTPCSIIASRLSSVTTRGLEITLPSPFNSAACEPHVDVEAVVEQEGAEVHESGRRQRDRVGHDHVVRAVVRERDVLLRERLHAADREVLVVLVGLGTDAPLETDLREKSRLASTIFASIITCGVWVSIALMSAVASSITDGDVLDDQGVGALVDVHRAARREQALHQLLARP